MTSANHRQPSGGRSRNNAASSTSSNKWKLIMVILLASSFLLMVMAYCSVQHSPEVPADPDDPTAGVTYPLHYDDLDLARRTPDSPVKGNTLRLDYEGFRMDFNCDNLTPDWVAWELLGSETNGDVPRSDRFWADPDVSCSPTTDDYRHSGYDRGHMCPAADQKWSEKAMRDCFVMTNMVPQANALNSGAWNTLEGKERYWARRDSAIVIIAGPIYTDNDTKRIGANGVRVPSAFFKVLLAPYTDTPRAIGFIYPNAQAPGNMADYAMSVDRVEEITGLDFFYNLPPDMEAEVEKSASFTLWNKN